jgi:hypothetical protein
MIIGRHEKKAEGVGSVTQVTSRKLNGVLSSSWRPTPLRARTPM